VCKFTGKELDAETGLYYLGARYYSPVDGIFLSVDPLAGSFPSWGPYVYTLNNPVRLTDPTGMAPEGGETDFYGLNGSKLGTDGVDNNQVVLVLDGELSEKISRASSQEIEMVYDFESLVVGDEQYNQFIMLPSNAEIRAIDGLYSNMERNHLEYGFVSDGTNISMTAGTKNSWDYESAAAEQIQKGGKIGLMIHSHTFEINTEKGTWFGKAAPSKDDGPVHLGAVGRRDSGDSNYTLNYSGVAGYTIRQRGNKFVRGSRELGFYDGTYRGSITYDKKFKNLIKNLNKKYNK
jgi:RHS repeat-associated protein